MPGPALQYGPEHYTADEAREYVQFTLIGNYLNYAVATLLVYELFTSLDDEVARIWPLKWRLPKILFMLNRYVIRAILVALWIVADFPSISPGFCQVYSWWQMFPLRLAILAAQALVVIRVWAIYNNSRRMLYLLSFLYACEFLAVLGSIIIATIDTQGVAQPAPLSCGLISVSGYLLKRYASATWIAPVVFEFVMVVITLFKLLPRWSFRSRPNSQAGTSSGLAFFGVALGSGGNPTLDVLARDSLVYFLFIFTFSLTNAVIYELSFAAYYHAILLGLTSAISCIAVSRMMINIRSIPAPTSHITEDNGEAVSISQSYRNINDGQYAYYGRHPYQTSNYGKPYQPSASNLDLDVAFADTYGGGGLGLGNLPPEAEDDVPGTARSFLGSKDDLRRPRRSTDIAYPPRPHSNSRRKPAPKVADHYAGLPSTPSTLVASPPASPVGMMASSSSLAAAPPRTSISGNEPPSLPSSLPSTSSAGPLHTYSPPEGVYESGYEAGLRIAKQRKERGKRPGTGDSTASYG
ncbi:hypothetical protein MIND_00748200 [Mycena indigotica]|uniref:DUF6533 domain-containing protein n=1 Tax=Mycena indigotica TaxID=2126181 RepID=A0A8H6W773_9AGAR|nr:uncharacterized protein MIND_00748200 [Mycena indigotica]KAF7301824.1 hypothetical protein MIND_00748200 [Mycena indigotica]